MSALSKTPDLSSLEIPIDAWTQPFWDGTAQHRLLLPRCSQCSRFRWPPGPFCPHCRSQAVEWLESGPGRVYSFTIIPEVRGAEPPPAHRVPALIEFPDADSVRLIGAIVDTPLSAIRIGSPVEVGWIPAANATVPVFRIASAL